MRALLVMCHGLLITVHTRCAPLVLVYALRGFSLGELKKKQKTFLNKHQQQQHQQQQIITIMAIIIITPKCRLSINEWGTYTI